MWNAIGEALKIFLEKHLIPTAISFVISIITLIKLPKDYWMIEKVGKTLFFILVLLISFLAIELVVFFVSENSGKEVLFTSKKFECYRVCKRRKTKCRGVAFFC